MQIKHYVITAGIITVAAAMLYVMGRNLICTCGYVSFWHPDPNSSGNSQHIADFYTFSHIIHGFIFYGALKLWARRIPDGKRFIIAVLIEVLWELIENSNMMIDRYRTATISLSYYGDSIINSVSDIIAFVIGYIFANRLPVWLTVTLAIVMELIVGYLIRDNLLLNILMLVYPLGTIKTWQSGG